MSKQSIFYLYGKEWYNVVQTYTSNYSAIPFDVEDWLSITGSAARVLQNFIGLIIKRGLKIVPCMLP